MSVLRFVDGWHGSDNYTSCCSEIPTGVLETTKKTGVNENMLEPSKTTVVMMSRAYERYIVPRPGKVEVYA